MYKLTAILLFFLTATLPVIIIAAPRTVTLWTFSPNKLAEWSNQKPDIEKRLGINLNISLVLQNVFTNKLQTAQSKGEGVPDIIEWLIQKNSLFADDPKNAAVEDITKYAEDSAVFSNITKGSVSWTTVGGHVYGLPHDAHPVVLIYNDTLWLKSGVNVEKIKTWDEFFKGASKLIKFEESGGKPVHFALPSGNSGLEDTMWMIWQQTGINILDNKGNPTLTSKDFIRFVKWWKSEYDSGVFMPWDWESFSSLLSNGTLCAYASPDWCVSLLDDAVKEGIFKFKVRALPLYGKSSIRTSSWGGSFLAIPRGNKDVPGIYAIMENMLYNKDSLLKLYSSSGIIPPLTNIWNDPSFEITDDRFSGFRLAELQIKLARELPLINNGGIFWDAVNAFNRNYSNIISGLVTVEAGLKAAQDEAAIIYRGPTLKTN